MKLQFGIEVTRYHAHLIVLGYHFDFTRKVPPRSMARKLKEDGAAAVCLSILYAKQGWFSEAHKASANPKSRWSDSESYITPVPSPRRHGGKGRIPVGDTNPSPPELMFAKNALGFEFGGDMKPEGASPPWPEGGGDRGPSKIAAERTEP